MSSTLGAFIVSSEGKSKPAFKLKDGSTVYCHCIEGDWAWQVVEACDASGHQQDLDLRSRVGFLELVSHDYQRKFEELSRRIEELRQKQSAPVNLTRAALDTVMEDRNALREILDSMDGRPLNLPVDTLNLIHKYYQRFKS